MRVPRVEEWSAAGGPEDGTGFITYKRIPLHWWLLHHWLERGHPHWGWWYRLWTRVLPYWGDPFCAAYVTVWARFYGSREEDRQTIEVGWGALPEAIRIAILARRDEDHEETEGPPPVVET